MKMSELELHAQNCLEQNKPLQVLIDMPGFEAPELIVNPPENISKKVEYYAETYDENCQHKHAEGISIVGVVYETDISDVSTALLPFTPLPLRKGHVRFTKSSYIGEASTDISVEGSVDGVLKVIHATESVVPLK